MTPWVNSPVNLRYWVFKKALCTDTNFGGKQTLVVVNNEKDYDSLKNEVTVCLGSSEFHVDELFLV